MLWPIAVRYLRYREDGNSELRGAYVGVHGGGAALEPCKPLPRFYQFSHDKRAIAGVAAAIDFDETAIGFAGGTINLITVRKQYADQAVVAEKPLSANPAFRRTA